MQILTFFHIDKEGIDLWQMEIIVCDSCEKMSDVAYKIFEKIILSEGAPTLGLATGSTPIGLYKKLIEGYKEKKISFKKVTTVNLDEYVGLKKNHPQSYAYFMEENLFKSVDIDRKRTNIPNGFSKNLKKECLRYSNLLYKHPRDIQLLGIGSNGHIAFNEPFSPFDGKTSVVNLSKKTIEDNSRFFDSLKDVPTRAISMGIEEIFSAKKILLLANGKNKAEAVYNAVRGPITPSCPASILQKHKDCTFILDKESASLL